MNDPNFLDETLSLTSELNHYYNCIAMEMSLGQIEKVKTHLNYANLLVKQLNRKIEDAING